MKKLVTLLVLGSFLPIYLFGQNVGVGQVSPTHTLHVTPLSANDPLRIDGLKASGNADTTIMIVNHLTGVVKYITPTDLVRLLGVDFVGGAGISITGNTITNTSPDIPVSITGTGGTTVSGAYPNYTVDSRNFTAGAGISVSPAGVITNTAQNQAISITGGGATTVSGAHPNFTISSTDNVNDADAVIGNEYNTGASLSGNILSITDGGGAQTVDLSSLTSGGGDPWLLGGNAGTTAQTNRLGTTDNSSLTFIVNDEIKAQIHSSGNFTIGSGVSNRDKVFIPKNDDFAGGIHIDAKEGVHTWADWYGQDIKLLTDATDTKSAYAIRNNIEGIGNRPTYGMYNRFRLTGTGTKYGTYNYFEDVPGTKYGVYNYFASGSETGSIYGTRNYILNQSSSIKYGTYNYISGATGTVYGDYTSVYPGSTSTSSSYGVRSYMGTSGTGNRYAGYFSSPKVDPNSYAAMFYSGNVVANEIGGNFDFRVETNNRDHALFVNGVDDIVYVGSEGQDYQNGTTVGTTVVDYVADFDNGLVDGTALGIGSIEFLLDGVAETTINNAFSPTTHLNRDLGFSSATRAWDDIYADNIVTTSDIREKDGVTDLSYGLKEIMKMRPVSYKLTRDPFGETKLGLIAQEVLPLVSESVKTHDHKILDEKTGKYEEVELERMGMKYQQLIPVLIKATQEQQGQISTLTETNEELKQENNELKEELESINKKLDRIMRQIGTQSFEANQSEIQGSQK